MSKENKVCPYCGGRGMKVVVQKELLVDGRPMSNEQSLPCICTLNGYVSRKHDRLSGVRDVSAKDAIEVAKKLPFTDSVIYGPEPLFLYILKCFIVMHFPFNKRFSVVTGSDIAEKFAMAQPDGIIPTVDLLTSHDLVAILCVARVNNRAIGPGTQEVIANRIRAHKPTWLYAPTSTLLLESKELAADEIHGSGVDLISSWPEWQLGSLFPEFEDFDKKNRVSSKKSKSLASNL